MPASGVKAVEVGMDGSTSSPFNLVGFTIVPGSISARTAQVAPPEPVAIAPVARASVPAPRVVPPAVPAVDPTTTVTPVAAPVEAGPGPLILGALVLAAAVLATLAIVRRVRIAAHPRLSGRSPGA